MESCEAMRSALVPITEEDADPPEYAKILGGYNTVVYDYASSMVKDCMPRDVNSHLAAEWLGQKPDPYYIRCPVEALYFAHGDLKVFALRDRVMLPINPMLYKYHGIQCKGPVVVSLYRAHRAALANFKEDKREDLDPQLEKLLPEFTKRLLMGTKCVHHIVRPKPIRVQRHTCCR